MYIAFGSWTVSHCHSHENSFLVVAKVSAPFCFWWNSLLDMAFCCVTGQQRNVWVVLSEAAQETRAACSPVASQHGETWWQQARYVACCLKIVLQMESDNLPMKGSIVMSQEQIADVDDHRYWVTSQKKISTTLYIFLKKDFNFLLPQSRDKRTWPLCP